MLYALTCKMLDMGIVSGLLRIYESSVAAVLPGNLVKKSIKYCDVAQELTIAGTNFNLKKKNVYVVGGGKAVQDMALGLANILGSKIKSGIISIPIGSYRGNCANKDIIFYEGAKNNLPDDRAVETAKKIKDLASSLKINDFLLVLLSGGGSALLSLPKAPVTLGDKTDLIKRLANSGADIKELNTVRKRISDLKGGQLAINAYPAQVASLILSDIVGDPLHLIASGPTTEDEDDYSEAINIINKYQLLNHIPKSIADILNSQSDYYKRFPKDNVYNFLIGSNKLSTGAANDEAKLLKHEPMILSNSVTGNVKDVARQYVKVTKAFCDFLNGKLNPDDLKSCLKTVEVPEINYSVIDNLNNKSNVKSLCLIFGGEITVKVKGSGKGGRNQQLALEFSNLLHNVKHDFDNFNIHFLSAGTDGMDGPTDVAGAIGYLNLVTDAERDGLNTNSYLENNDSYNFYKRFRNGELHVVTGHTNTNVMDIHLIILQKLDNITITIVYEEGVRNKLSIF